jgi:signal transduction histidine kinase/CheY-like chemotaxis protein
MPEGHLPVRSCLAVPVVARSGEMLGGLFFGHEQPAVFSQQAENIIVGIAAQASIAIDNARLYKQVQALLERERSLRTEAERVSQMKDEFLATLSHELRTPLNAIIGWTQLLLDGDRAAEARHKALHTIQRNARAQARLIDDLLDMSRIISGKVRLELREVDLHDVIDAALNVVRPTAVAKGVHLDTSLETDLSPVPGDASRLQQVVWNLLTNAIKFTPPGGRVQVTLAPDPGGVRLSISDTGVGIEPYFLPFVFDRFRQADGSTTRQHGGLGLGLSIVKNLTEMHGGTVEARSAGIDRGATFTITLPAMAERLLSSPPEEHRSRRPVPGAEPSAVLQGARVLIVDDDEDALELTQAILEAQCAEVLPMRSAADALRTLQSRPCDFHVIVSDLAMPGMDGFELLKRIRSAEHERLRELPAIALSAYARREDQARASEAGYVAHISKPFDPARLVAACVNVLPRAEGAG